MEIAAGEGGHVVAPHDVMGLCGRTARLLAARARGDATWRLLVTERHGISRDRAGAATPFFCGRTSGGKGPPRWSGCVGVGLRGTEGHREGVEG